jgi:hypothetical protein
VNCREIMRKAVAQDFRLFSVGYETS